MGEQTIHSPLTILTLKMLSFTRQMDYALNLEWASNKYYSWKLVRTNFAVSQEGWVLRKQGPTYYTPLQSFLAQYSAANVPYLHPPAAFWDRWIRILTEISTKRQTFIHTTQSRPCNILSAFSKPTLSKGASSWQHNTGATPAALPNSGFCANVVSTHQTSSQALARLLKSSKCLHGNLLSQGASFAGEIPEPLLFERGRQFGRSIMPA